MKLSKKAFTLTELLIALAVIGVLAAILLPVISNILPDQNVVMAKRAYYAAQSIVSEAINNPDCYPDTSKTRNVYFKRIGFDDGYRYPNCEGWEADLASTSEDYYKEGEEIPTGYEVGDPKEGDAQKKFEDLIMQAFDQAQNSNKSSTEGFATKDGIHWAMKAGDGLSFEGADHKCGDYSEGVEEHNGSRCNPHAYTDLYVDVNGADAPNKTQPGAGGIDIKGIADQSDGVTKSEGSESDTSFDVFRIRVYADGRMEVMDEWAKRAINASQDIMETTNVYESP